LISRSKNIEYFDQSNDITHSEFSHLFHLHYHNYTPDQPKSLFFSGGAAPYSYWMEKEDIVYILNALGYQRIDWIRDDPDYPVGPAFSLLARV
jgi:hypothetical protein